MNERTASESTHDLLLAMAGRVDDDMLGWARELVAVGEDARAVELLTASLIADRAGLPEPVHTALVAAGRAARIDLDAAALPVAGSDDFTTHRFDSAPPAVPDVAAAVRALPARQLRDCRVQLTWRLTPAGSAPGPLPHPVVLVEVDAGGPPTDVLAYQLAVALDRAGAQASVEVLTAGRPLSAYHSAALRDAVPARPDSTGASPDAFTAVDGPGRYEHPLDYNTYATHEAPRDVPVDVLDDVQDDEPEEERDGSPPFPPGSDPLADPMPVAAGSSGDSGDDEDDYDGSDYESADYVDRPESRPLTRDDTRDDDTRHDIRDDTRDYDPRDFEPAEYAYSAPEEAESEYAGPEHPEPEYTEEPVETRFEAPQEPAAPHRQQPQPDNTATTMFASRQPKEPLTSEQRQPTTPLRTTPPLGHRPMDPPPPVPIRAVPDPGGRRRKPPAGDEVAGEVNPRPAPRPIPARQPPTRRPTVTPISRTSMPSPIPLVRRDGTPPAARPLHPVSGDTHPPFGPPAAPSAVPLFGEPIPIPEQKPPARSESSALAGLDDPLNGPLNQPLMASLLEPTILEDDPLGVGDITEAEPEHGAHGNDEPDDRTDDHEGDRHEPEPEVLEVVVDDEPEHVDDDVLDAPDDAPDRADDLADDEPADGVDDQQVVDGQWANEWSSGSWAMAPSALGDLATDDDVDGDADADAGRRRARHRSGAELAAEAGEPAQEQVLDVEPAPPAPLPAPPAPLPPAPMPAAPMPAGPENRELGLRPESLARLSDADRELLARLQAELGQGRKPRVTRRAGVGQPNNGTPTNGSGPTNGHGSGPPDLAG